MDQLDRNIRNGRSRFMSVRTLVTVRKLIFRNYWLNVLRFALDAVSETSICLNGHVLNDRVNHRWISGGNALWPLRLMANVFIQLKGI